MELKIYFPYIISIPVVNKCQYLQILSEETRAITGANRITYSRLGIVVSRFCYLMLNKDNFNYYCLPFKYFYQLHHMFILLSLYS